MFSRDVARAVHPFLTSYNKTIVLQRDIYLTGNKNVMAPPHLLFSSVDDLKEADEVLGLRPTVESILHAIRLNDLDLVHYIIEQYPEILLNIEASEVLIDAASRLDDMRILKDLMCDKRINLSSVCLANAVDYGMIKAVRIMLSDPRVDPTEFNNNVILGAAYTRNANTEAIVDILIKTGRFPDTVVQKALRLLTFL